MLRGASPVLFFVQFGGDEPRPKTAESYAAYALCRGTVDNAIRLWSSRGGHQPPDAWTEQVLSALYRAKALGRNRVITSD